MRSPDTTFEAGSDQDIIWFWSPSVHPHQRSRPGPGQRQRHSWCAASSRRASRTMTGRPESQTAQCRDRQEVDQGAAVRRHQAPGLAASPRRRISSADRNHTVGMAAVSKRRAAIPATSAACGSRLKELSRGRPPHLSSRQPRHGLPINLSPVRLPAISYPPAAAPSAGSALRWAGHRRPPTQ